MSADGALERVGQPNKVQLVRARQLANHPKLVAAQFAQRNR